MIMITMPIIGCTWSGQNPNFSKNPKLAAPLFSWSCGTVQKLLRISTTQSPLYRKPCEDDDLRAWQCKLDLIQSQARWGWGIWQVIHTETILLLREWSILHLCLSPFLATKRRTQLYRHKHTYMLSHRYTNTQSYLLRRTKKSKNTEQLQKNSFSLN